MLRILIDVFADDGALCDLKSRPDVRVDVVAPVEAARVLPVELIEEAEILFCTYPPVNCAEMRKLRWIQLASTGYSQLFEHKLPSRGIRATNSRGCFDVPIAEWNLAMMVNLVRDLPLMLKNQEARIWDRSARFQRELRGMTVGIWGYGGIGRETARVAKLLGMRVHVLSRKGVTAAGDVYRVPGTGDPEGILPDQVFLRGQEKAFLAGLDFLIIAMPLTPQTEGIVGEEELRALPERAFLLNPARGPIVREAALLRALREGWIAGAAIDTHYIYPMPAEHPLWGFPNVIFTPHISGSSLNPMFTRRLWGIFGENIDRYAAVSPLLNELTTEQLSGL